MDRINEHVYSTPLPKGSPDPISLKNMLMEAKCFVCNRPIEKDSEAFKHIEKLLEKNNNSFYKQNKTDLIDEFLDELYKSFNNFPSEQIIKQEKENLTLKWVNLKNSLSDFSQKEKSLRHQLKYESAEFDKKWKDHKDLENQISKLQIDIDNISRDIKNEKQQLELYNSQLKKYATSYDDNYEKKTMYLKDIKNAIFRTVNNKNSNMANSLQYKIKNLTLNSETNPGKVIINVTSDKKFISELQNDQGGLLTGQGTAFQRMKQLSIMIGITKLKSDNDYPLIADAPVSEMGEILTQNFFYNVPKHFKQSIILVKDLYSKDENISDINDFGKNLINNLSLNPKVYLNTAIGKEQHERNTKVNLIASGK